MRATAPPPPPSQAAPFRCRTRLHVAPPPRAFSVDPAVASAAALATVAAAAAAASFAADTRVDYALTARLKATVAPTATNALIILPRDAPTSASRDLFLLPNAIATCTVAASDGAPVDAAYWGRAGVQAGVRVSTTTTRALALAPPSTPFSVAVARAAIATAPDRQALLTSVARVLAPGAVLIAVERLSRGGGPVASLPWRASRPNLPRSALESALDAAPGWARIALDVVGDGVAVVVAQRDESVIGGGAKSRGGGKADMERLRVPGSQQARGKKGKGFR